MNGRNRFGGRRARRGGALLAALLVVMLVAGLSAAMLSMSSAASRRHVAAVDHKRALYLAEAGLAEACLGLTLGKTGNVGTAELPAEFGEGLFWVEASAEEGGVTKLESTALCGTGRAALSIYVANASEPVGALGFFGADQMEVGAEATVDGFDSGADEGEGEGADDGGDLKVGLDDPGLVDDLGQAAGLPAPEKGVSAQLGSNGDVSIGCGAWIDGGVTPGPEGTALLGSGATVTGSTLPSEKGVELPPIEVPELASAGDLVAMGLVPVTLTSEQSYGQIRVQSGASLVLDGPLTLVASTLHIKSGGTLAIDTTGGPVAVYITQLLFADAESNLVSQGASAAACTINVTAADGVDLNGDGQGDPAVVLLGQGVLYGLVYAPAAAVSLPASLAVYGGVVAKSLVIAPGAALHYDAALAQPVQGAMVPKMVSWQILDLPEEARKLWSADPKVALGIGEGVILPKPCDAHEQALWGIKFVDKLGVTQTWVGVKTAFDWLNVQSIVWQGNSTDPGWPDIIGNAAGASIPLVP